MKKYLLPEKGNFYKANLHTHTKVSDGSVSALKMKEVYQEHGYSIMAFSDHEMFVTHNELTDENFLALNAVELGVTEEPWPHNYPKHVHIGAIALDENIDTQPLYHRTKYIRSHYGFSREDLKIDETEHDYERIYSIEGVNDMVKRLKEKNYFVVYNHPAWSHASYPQYINYEGFDAIEMINHISNRKTGICEYNEQILEDILRRGKQVYCIAADDSHGIRESWCCGAWNMIKAEKLYYSTIAKALKNGDFYASEGPEIKALWYEDGKFHVECSPADRIVFTAYPARGKAFWAIDEPDGGSTGITQAEYSPLEPCEYVRITIIDKNGKKAYSNAYFMNELNKGV